MIDMNGPTAPISAHVTRQRYLKMFTKHKCSTHSFSFEPGWYSEFLSQALLVTKAQIILLFFVIKNIKSILDSRSMVAQFKSFVIIESIKLIAIQFEQFENTVVLLELVSQYKSHWVILGHNNKEYNKKITRIQYKTRYLSRKVVVQVR